MIWKWHDQRRRLTDVMSFGWLSQMITYKTKNLMMSSDQLDFDVCTNGRILCGSHHFAFWFSPNQSHNFQAIITNKIGLRKQKKKNSTTKLSWKLLLWIAFYYLNIFFFKKIEINEETTWKKNWNNRNNKI